MLFLATNLAIIVVLSITLRLLGVERILDARGVDLDLKALLVFAAVLGMGGSFISLALSKWTAKRFTGAQVIERPSNPTEQWLVETVRRQAQAAGIVGIPIAYRRESVSRRQSGRWRSQRACNDGAVHVTACTPFVIESDPRDRSRPAARPV